MNQKSLYERLGGYDGLSAFADKLLPRLRADSQLGRLWAHRGDDGLAREKHYWWISCLRTRVVRYITRVAI